MSATRLQNLSHSSDESEFPKFFGTLHAAARHSGAASAHLRGVKSLRRLMLVVYVAIALLAWPARGNAQSAVATVTVALDPRYVAVNPVTNKIYIANQGGTTVTVIDGATNIATAVTVGAQPDAVAVNPVTNRIYVSNQNDGTVTVIDGATNTIIAAAITVGTQPFAVAVNPVTNKIYVANSSSGNVTVIDGVTNATTPVTVGDNPLSLAVNPVTNQVYVANEGSNNVTIIDGATSTVIAAAVAVSSAPVAIAVNPVTNKIYVANQGSNNVTVIDGATNTPTPVSVGQSPTKLSINPVTNKIYVANEGSNNVTVIDGVTNTPTVVAAGLTPYAVTVNPTTNQIYVLNVNDNSMTVIDGATATVSATLGLGSSPQGIAVNPVTNQVYAANTADGTVTVIDAATRITSTVTVGSSSQTNGTSIAANPATHKIYVPNSFTNSVTVITEPANTTTTVSGAIGTIPNNVAINPVTNTIYVTNLADSTVSVINGSTDAVSAVVTVGTSSQTNRTSIAANPVTNKVYVPNSFSNTVSVIDGVTNAATTITAGVGGIPNAVAINTATNKIYVTNLEDSTVSVIDGISDTVSAVVAVGTSSQTNGTSIAVNRVTNKIYVPNSFSNTVTVINGVTNSTTTITTGIGMDPDNVAVNAITNKIYVTNLGDATVSVIDGSTDTVVDVVTVGSSSQTNRTSIMVNPVTNKIYVPNSFTNTITVIDGATDTTTTLTPGTDPNAVAVDLATNNIFVTNLGDSTVTAIAEENVQPVPLTTTIAAIVGGIVTTSTPTFGFSAASTFAPTAPAIGNVYYQVDTWEGPWIVATPSGGNFTSTVTAALEPGTHVVYAFATDGQDADSTGLAQKMIGGITPEVFTVILPATTTTLVADVNPAAVGQTVTFTATVASLASGTPTGTVTFFDGVTSLGPGTFVSGVATLATSSLALGSHGITAVYSGDGNFAGSVSAAVTEIIQANNPVPVLTSLSQTTATAGDASFTLTLTGTSFVSNSVVDWNGVALVTTFISATQISAVVPIGDLATAGTIPVTVFNPLPVGGTSSAITFTINNPAPALTLLSPATVVGGGPTFTLTVTGTGFVNGSVVDWNGVARTTTFVSATSLTASIPSTDIASSGNATVTVVNATPGGGTSNGLTLTITTPLPTLTLLQPATATAGGAAFTLTLTGTNFISTSQVMWNGVALTTTFGSATSLTAAVPIADIAAGGTVPVTVFNPAGVASGKGSNPQPAGPIIPSGATSNALTFTINNPLPTLISLSQTSATAGDAAFTLTLTGTNFVPTSVVDWNGVALVTTFVSATQITAAVPVGDLTTAGTANVTVVNAAPGGGTSGGISFAINNPAPTLTSLSQTSVTAGAAGSTLTITGTNFVGTSVVNWNGTPLTTTFVSATSLTAVVPLADFATAGTASVTVTNPAPGGGTSTGITFTINNPAPTLLSLSQTTAIAGAAGFSLNVTGTNFVAGSVVNWNGVALVTTFTSATQLAAAVPLADLATAGTFSVTVFNALPGGGTSTGINFVVSNPVPTLASLSQTSAAAGAAGFTLTVTGTNFVATSAVDWNGVPLVTTFVSATSLTAAVPLANLAAAGAIPVTVFNPLPGGGVSTALTFTVNNPAPILISLSQTSALVGAAAITLNVTGTNFVATSVVDWNGTPLTTTFSSATLLIATIPVGDLTTAGTANVTVVNPAPGGGTSTAAIFTVNNTVPTLVSLSQTSAIAGAAGFSLTVTGTNFISGSTVDWNGAPLVTTFTSATQLIAAVPMADIAAGGTASVTVVTPAPGGGTSAPLTFTIDNPAPTLSALSQTSALAGAAAVTLTVTGTNFNSSSVVQWNGVSLVTTFTSATQLTATIPIADLATGGTALVTVFNPLPGGGASTAITFTINNPAPTLASLSQTSAAAGAAGFTLTVTGTNFVATSVVDWNGVPLVTTFVSATSLTAAVPLADLTAAGTIPVTVFNPLPGGGTSTAVTFTINNPAPTLTSLSQNSALVGAAAITLNVTGTNFVATSVVDWNGTPLTTTFSSATLLIATVPVGDLTAAGTAAVTIVNPAPGGGTSTAVTFTINNTLPTLVTLSQTSAIAGTAGFSLTVTGTNFISGSTVDWNGAPLVTTFTNSTQLIAAVPMANIAIGGTASITIVTPAPGGGTSAALDFAINNPVPTLGALSQTSAIAGAAAVTLTVTGTNFTGSSVVQWNAVNLVTTFTSATQLVATIPIADLATGGTALVTVFNPLPGGGASTAITFTINNPAPTLGSLSQTSAIAGAAGFTLTVTGTNFVATSVVDWNGTPLVTTFVSATQLTAVIPIADLADEGTASVTVFNAAPAGGTSAALVFTINDPVPTLGSLAQTSANVGAAALTLSVTGTNFNSTSVVNWNGAPLVTVFVSATQLTATVPATDFLTAGTASVTVVNPAPGGGTTAALTFTIDNTAPVLGSLSQTSALAGSAGFTLTLAGTNFVTGSVVDWNGVPLATVVVSATQLTAVVPIGDLATAGTASVTVVNPSPGGGTSSPLTFTINNPVPVLGALVQTSAIAGTAGFTLTVNGTSFVNGAVVQWNGVALVTTFVSATQLMAAVPAGDIATGGTASVTVANPAPGGGSSAALTFTINDPVPTLGTLSQTTASAGSAAFVLTLTGTNFVGSTVVNWNGVPLATTFVSATQVTAMVPAADLLAGATISVTVFNPLPGGGTSVAITLTVTDFSVTATTPVQTVVAGGSVMYTIGTAPVGGAFANPVTFTATGLPIGAFASFTPPSVSPGTGTTLTITTTARPVTTGVLAPFDQQTPRFPIHIPGPSSTLFAALLASLLGAGISLLAFAKMRTRTGFGSRAQTQLRRLAPATALALLIVVVGYAAGCSSNGFPRPVPPTGTPAGTYTIIVTGTSGTDVHSTPVTLIVQ